MAWISVHRNIVYHWNPRVRCRHNVWKEGGMNISMEVQIFLNVGTVGNVFMGGPNSTWQINLHSFVCGLYCTNLQSGYTLLHDAACGGSVELLKWLVEEKGLDVQEWNKVFCSPCTFNNCTCIAEFPPLISHSTILLNLLWQMRLAIYVSQACHKSLANIEYYWQPRLLQYYNDSNIRWYMTPVVTWFCQLNSWSSPTLCLHRTVASTVSYWQHGMGTLSSSTTWCRPTTATLGRRTGRQGWERNEAHVLRMYVPDMCITTYNEMAVYMYYQEWIRDYRGCNCVSPCIY